MVMVVVVESCDTVTLPPSKTFPGIYCPYLSIYFCPALPCLFSFPVGWLRIFSSGCGPVIQATTE